MGLHEKRTQKQRCTERYQRIQRIPIRQRLKTFQIAAWSHVPVHDSRDQIRSQLTRDGVEEAGGRRREVSEHGKGRNDQHAGRLSYGAKRYWKKNPDRAETRREKKDTSKENAHEKAISRKENAEIEDAETKEGEE